MVFTAPSTVNVSPEASLAGLTVVINLFTYWAPIIPHPLGFAAISGAAYNLSSPTFA